jgi:hypothetical protein
LEGLSSADRRKKKKQIMEERKQQKAKEEKANRIAMLENLDNARL